MRSNRVLIAFIAFMLGAICSSLAHAETPRGQLLREAASTVMIDTEKHRGSGVVVARHDGAAFILTCLHVVEAQHDIGFYGFFAAGTGHRARASVEDIDEAADLALLYTFDPAFTEPASPIAVRSPQVFEALDVFGLPNSSPSVSTGRVTSMRLYKYGITGAVIEHGESGGPAFNAAGEVACLVSEIEMTRDQEDIFNMGYCVSRFAIVRLAGPYLIPPMRADSLLIIGNAH